MKKILREHMKMIDSIQKLYPLAEINILHTKGKHCLKLVIKLDGRTYKRPLPCTPSDENWRKQAIRQIKNSISESRQFDKLKIVFQNSYEYAEF